ncbi:MAG: alpha/beta hydrolase-fold protein [Acidobacteriota bacterium]
MKRTTCFVLCLCLASVFTFAGEPILIGETIKMQSKVMGEERTILVSTPPGYDQGSQFFPVLYMTDGDAHLTHTRGTVDFLNRNGLMPQVIIVGVTNTDRTRDLTPTHAVITEEDGTERDFPTSGGASKFQDFFSEELFAYVEDHYRTMPFRIFSGHSFGGLFALDLYLTRPDLFQAVLAISPSLRWDDELSLRQARSFFADRPEVKATLFVAMADEEEGDPRPNRLDRFEKVLEGAEAEDFEWQVRRMPDETHGSVVLRAQYWGLRKAFEPWNLPRDPETGRFSGGIDSLKAHFSGLSERYGFTVIPPELQVNAIGYQTLGSDAINGAIKIFRYNAELYPDSANVYDSLAEALETAEDAEEALANYTTAVKTAERVGDQRLEIFKANLDRFKKESGSSSAE